MAEEETGTLTWEGNVLRYRVDANGQLRTHWSARDRERWERDGWTVTPDVPAPTWIDERDPHCVEAWPECESFGHDPRCCRFPKSCSAGGWRAAIDASESNPVDG